jgi:diguanylate cyclase (GGDEF)-like protein
MFTSVRGKILSLLIGVLLLAVGIASWLHVESSLNTRRAELRERAHDIGEFIGLTFADELLKGTSIPHEKQKLMQVWVDNKSQVNFFAVYNTAGKPLLEQPSAQDSLPPSENLTPTFIRRLINTRPTTVTRSLTQDTTYDFLVPVELFEIQFGVVRLGFDASRFRRDRNRIIQQNFLFGGLVILAAIALGWLFTHYLVKPIKHLEKTAQKFGEGSLSVRASVDSGDEIQRLGEQFNTMASQVESKINDLRTIEELNRKISARLRPEKLYDRIVNLVSQTWDVPYVGLILESVDRKELKIVSGYNMSAVPSENLRNMTDDLEELNRQTQERAETRTEYPMDHGALEPLFSMPDSESLSDGLVFKLVGGDDEDQRLGYFVMGQRDAQFESSSVKLLRTLSHHIKIAVQNANNYERAVTDDLTGLYTRRFFEMELEEEMEKAEGNQLPLSLAMIDIDDFKEYNDTYGHPAGDEVLETVADLFRSEVRGSDLKEASRESDTVARYGGEEFSIILPATTGEEGRRVGERIVEAVAEIDSFETQVTISLGVTEYRPDESRMEFIERADRALYEAKSQGKNRVCFKPADD